MKTTVRFVGLSAWRPIHLLTIGLKPRNARVTGSSCEGQPGLFGNGKRVYIGPLLGFALEVRTYYRLSYHWGMGNYLLWHVQRQSILWWATLNLQLCTR